jgi:hypothetical protein
MIEKLCRELQKKEQVTEAKSRVLFIILVV